MTDQEARRREPMRRCLICRRSLPKQQMLRLVVDPEGQVWPDLLQQAPGRGVYHCMGEQCVKRTNDKRLGALKAHFSVALPRWEQLRERIKMALEQQLLRMVSRQRASAAIGRDAVMHRLWNNAPLLLLQAADAGSALVRQLDDAVAKRVQAGCQVRRVLLPSRQLLGTMCGRDDVAVAGIAAAGAQSALAERIERYCVWLETVGEITG